ncbi:MAG: class I SAM-dependent rRNA methyltransferase [Gammaproteobacteria bacterium]|nr:class I SAM-dependent rRNA methyltransferase [Rhodocyclaceae bacterium]MBU3910708.1 class I SAM-dependent rRNA methyltransferase [Gammaproteobacteria bacterium]MBU3988506.1 class I SAM-dependent rRNA methyltransferase [Gammaproteobacteria bacterium]MBU4003417.1 class I SAM-dependent rRNA methyltransferase [Gammaproteobacteria bacterium]MBU4021888.1 class I SAM-dependent rRNA methyltransferase [Gammaproteobacteria bacterium]
MSAQLILHPGKERSLFKRHPWLFDTAVARLDGPARPGDTVTIHSADGRPLAKAAYSPLSKIRARVWSFDIAETIDHAFFKRRVAEAVARRAALPELAGQGEHGGLRLIHAESDGLPGIIADQYGDTVVVQLTSAGAEKWRAAIVDALAKATGCARIYERSDSEVRGLEGLEPTTGWLLGEAPEREIVIEEHGVKLAVDIVVGHKTGFYLDQRENRRLLAGLSAGKRVLNCFCYTGGFSLQALAGGAASVLSIDSSQPALQQAAANLALNPQLAAERAHDVEWRCANVFDELRRLKAAGETFDLIVLDPPKFAPSASHAERASRAYKDINLHGFKLLSPGGLLMTYSCSGGVGLDLFQKIAAAAACDAGRTARIVKRLQGSADHPVDLAFPEGEYLKGLLLQVA